MKSSDSSGWRLYSSVIQQFIGSRVVQLTSGAKCAPGTPSYCCLQSSRCLTSLPAPLLPSIPTRVPCGNPSPVHRNTDTYLPVWGKQLLLLAPWTPSNICPGRRSHPCTMAARCLTHLFHQPPSGLLVLVPADAPASQLHPVWILPVVHLG